MAADMLAAPVEIDQDPAFSIGKKIAIPWCRITESEIGISGGLNDARALTINGGNAWRAIKRWPFFEDAYFMAALRQQRGGSKASWAISGNYNIVNIIAHTGPVITPYW